MAEHSTATIAALDDDAFADYVRKHLHPATGAPEAWQALLGDVLIDRTVKHLNEVRQRTERTRTAKAQKRSDYQLECLARGAAGMRDWQAYDAEYEDWRKRANGFFRLIVNRQTEALQALRSVRRARHEQHQFESAQHQRNAIRDLTVRIHQHQALTAASGRTPEQHDYDLWRLLDEITVPLGADNTPATLRNMMRAYWFQTTPATVADGNRAQAERLMRQAPAGHSPSFEGTPKAKHVAQPKRLT